MLVIQKSSPVDQRDRSCSDCGRSTTWQKPFFDYGTHSQVKLCPTCAVALRQRQQFWSGCCGEFS